MDSFDGFQSNHFFLNLCDIICRFPGSSNFWLHPPSYIQGQGQLRRVWNEAVRSNGIQVCSWNWVEINEDNCGTFILIDHSEQLFRFIVFQVSGHGALSLGRRVLRLLSDLQ